MVGKGCCFGGHFKYKSSVGGSRTQVRQPADMNPTLLPPELPKSKDTEYNNIVLSGV